MNSKGYIRPGKSQVMQSTNKATIGMNICYGLTTMGRESDMWYTGSFAGTAVNHIMLGEQICSILGLSDSEALCRSLNLQAKKVTQRAHILEFKHLPESMN
jgi:hypothetical protein